ncbi:uncharacterized protein LOC141628342 [Silene latifolia]|uniref:uncharacterized protein LOC141628342 n=1 Tax=Silene latifolia TaxID=37657 RepID=UPI003D783BA1
MNFQYLRAAKENDSVSKTVSQNSSQAVAGGIFQLNTDVTALCHLVDTVDPSIYNPQLRDKLDTMSQDIMLQVKETLDKLSDYFGWPYDQTNNVSLTKDEVKGRKFAKVSLGRIPEGSETCHWAFSLSESKSIRDCCSWD